MGEDSAKLVVKRLQSLIIFSFEYFKLLVVWKLNWQIKIGNPIMAALMVNSLGSRWAGNYKNRGD